MCVCVGGGRGGLPSEGEKDRGRGGCVITSVCLEVRGIKQRLIGGYGSANDNSTADNTSIVARS